MDLADSASDELLDAATVFEGRNSLSQTEGKYSTSCNRSKRKVLDLLQEVETSLIERKTTTFNHRLQMGVRTYLICSIRFSLHLPLDASFHIPCDQRALRLVPLGR
jgi:hypothetical protein